MYVYYVPTTHMFLCIIVLLMLYWKVRKKIFLYLSTTIYHLIYYLGQPVGGISKFHGLMLVQIVDHKVMKHLCIMFCLGKCNLSQFIVNVFLVLVLLVVLHVHALTFFFVVCHISWIIDDYALETSNKCFEGWDCIQIQ